MASTSDTDDVLNQILRGGSAGSSLRKYHYRFTQGSPTLAIDLLSWRFQIDPCSNTAESNDWLVCKPILMACCRGNSLNYLIQLCWSGVASKTFSGVALEDQGQRPLP